MSKLIVQPESEHPRVLLVTTDTVTIGAAPDNDLCLSSPGVAPYHARLERQGELVTIVDLSGTGQVEVDGRPVQRFVLGHRSRVRIGTVELLYLEDGLGAGTALQTVVPALPVGPVCAGCRQPLPPGATVCPQCGLLATQRPTDAPVPAELYLRPAAGLAGRGAGILPMLGFFFGLFGPLILGIGWLLAIILGFISLSLLRQRGGYVHERRYALGAIGLGFAWIAVLVAAGFYFAHRQQRQQRQVQQETIIKQNETEAAYLLKELATVQEFLRATQAVPGENGGSAYADLAQLQRLPNPFLPADRLAEQQDGYLFTVKAQADTGFTATAVPVQYGVTGRKTFLIDQSGILRGADIGGRPPWEHATVLPELELGRSVYLEARERIARELLVEARRLAEDQKFDRSQFILRELKRKYVLTETFKNFENVAQGIEQLVINAQAEAAAARARATLAAGKRPEALAQFRQVLATYPRAAIVETLKAEADNLDRELAAERDALARTRWAEAVQREQDSPAAAALAAYRAFARDFANTPTFQAHKAELDAALARLEETQAAVLLAQLRRLDPREHPAAVVQLTNQMQNNYRNAPSVRDNQAMLQTLQQQAQAHLLAQEANQLATNGKYLEATERFDRALALHPALATEVAAQLEQCYFESGEALFAAGKLAEAANAYERYLQITSQPQRVDRDRLKQIYLHLGETSFLNKNYTNAVTHFQRGAEYFGTETKYYRMYGQSLLRQKKFTEALPVYQQLITLAKDDPQARFERALCLLGTANLQQTNLLVTLRSAVHTNVMPVTTDRPSAPLAAYTLPSTVRDDKVKREEVEILKMKQFEMRLNEMFDRLKSYSIQTPEGVVIREAIRLVNEIQAAAADLETLNRKAMDDTAQGKVTRARSQLLSVFATQQDYFDRIIGERLAHKQSLLTGLDRLKTMLETSAADLTAATTLETNRGAVAALLPPLQTKLDLLNRSCADLLPALESEIRVLEEARNLMKLAVSQFRGWVIGWNLNDRVEKFFFVNFNEMADKHARGELVLQECLKIPLTPDPYLGL